MSEDLPEFLDPPRDPLALVRQWIERAETSGVQDALAASLATVSPDGAPSVRFVAVEEVNDDGVVFATSSDSPKVRDMGTDPRVALALYWPETMQQVRITGQAIPLDDAASDRFFRRLPRDAQAAVLTARQSRPLESEAALRESARRLELGRERLERPVTWRGWLVSPSTVEFWAASEDKLHWRLAYTCSGGTWTARRLQP